jgi:hypothetical protein
MISRGMIVRTQPRRWPVAGRDPAKVVDLPKVIAEVSEEMEQELARRERRSVVGLGIPSIERLRREAGDHRRDAVAHRFDAADNLGLGDVASAELERPIAHVGDASELAADEFAQVAFEMKRERPRGIAHAGCRAPERRRIGKRAQLLGQALEVAGEEGS